MLRKLVKIGNSYAIVIDHTSLASMGIKPVQIDGKATLLVNLSIDGPILTLSKAKTLPGETPVPVTLRRKKEPQAIKQAPAHVPEKTHDFTICEDCGKIAELNCVCV